jgi:hypothetical protein
MDGAQPAGAGQFDGHSQARERGAQLVGNIREQAAFRREERLDAGGHAVERSGKASQFVPAARIHTRGEIAAAESVANGDGTTTVDISFDAYDYIIVEISR